MKKEGVIKKALWNIDFDKWGIKGRIDLLIKIDANGKKNMLAEKILNVINVISVTFTEGDYDILALAIFWDVEQLDQITNALSEIEGILRLDFCIGLTSRYPFSDILRRARSRIYTIE